MLLILIKSRTDICLSITEKSNSCPQTAENKNMNTIIEIFVFISYSHSMVAGGLELIS